MKVTRELSHPENPKRNDDKKQKRTLGKILSAFSRGRKTASSSSSNVGVVDVPRMAPSPRVNISSVSSSSSYGERPNGPNGRVTMADVSSELTENGTQTAALRSVPSATYYRRHQLPSDLSYSSYPKYKGGYPTSRVPKCEVDRRHTVEMAAAAAASSWRRRAGQHVPTVTSSRHHKRSSTNEMDILSFFDTGSVDHGYSYKCTKDGEAVNSDAIHAAREGCGSTVQQLPSSDSQSGQQQLMLEDKDARSIDHHLPSQRRNHTDCQPVDEVVDDPSYIDNKRMRPAPAPFHLQTVKNSHQCEEGGGPTSFWYCEKMDKSKAKRIPDANECEPAGCCERVFDPTKLCQQQAERLQQTRGGGRTLFNRQINTEEKRRLAKIGAIILATAGVAALIMLLVKYRSQAQLCKSILGDECDAKSNDTFDDDDDGVCIFEKFDRVKCQNNNFKAMMSNSEKLIEHDDRVCASQDFKKVTKRLKEQSETKPKDVFCHCSEKECSDINKKKCFDNF